MIRTHFPFVIASRTNKIYIVVIRKIIQHEKKMCGFRSRIFPVVLVVGNGHVTKY